MISLRTEVMMRTTLSVMQNNIRGKVMLNTIHGLAVCELFVFVFLDPAVLPQMSKLKLQWILILSCHKIDLAKPRQESIYKEPNKVFFHICIFTYIPHRKIPVI